MEQPQNEKTVLLPKASETTVNYRTTENSRAVVYRKPSIGVRLTQAYKLKSLFTVKPVEAFLAERESRPKGYSLAETLGLVDLLGYGVGCTVGAGIYSLIGIGAGIAGK